MRRLKDMIIVRDGLGIDEQSKAKTGGADNMHLMNDARAMVRVWGEGFLPYASQGRGKVIVEGYQEMQRDGAIFVYFVTHRNSFPRPDERGGEQVGSPDHGSDSLVQSSRRIQCSGDERSFEACAGPGPEGTVS